MICPDEITREGRDGAGNEPVLSETAFHVRSSELPLDMLDSGMLRLALVLTGQRAALRGLAKLLYRPPPRPGGSVLIRMSELYLRHSVITVDEADFRVYRRNKRELIPIICPPK